MSVFLLLLVLKLQSCEFPLAWVASRPQALTPQNSFWGFQRDDLFINVTEWPPAATIPLLFYSQQQYPETSERPRQPVCHHGPWSPSWNHTANPVGPWILFGTPSPVTSEIAHTSLLRVQIQARKLQLRPPSPHPSLFQIIKALEKWVVLFSKRLGSLACLINRFLFFYIYILLIQRQRIRRLFFFFNKSHHLEKFTVAYSSTSSK